MKHGLKILGAASAVAVLLSGCAYDPYYQGYNGYGAYRGYNTYSGYAGYPYYGYDYGYPSYGYYGAPYAFDLGLGYYGYGGVNRRGRFVGRGFAGRPRPGG